MSDGFRVEIDGRCASLVGELDLVGVDQFLASLQPLLDEPGDITIVLSDLTFMDSSGLEALLKVEQGMRGTLRLSAPRPAVLRVFEITGTLGRFTFLGDSAEA